VFVSPRDLTELSGASWLSGFEDGLCPRCRDVSLRDFRFSTGEEIQAVGFSPAEYLYSRDHDGFQCPAAAVVCRVKAGALVGGVAPVSVIGSFIWRHYAS